MGPLFKFEGLYWVGRCDGLAMRPVGTKLEVNETPAEVVPRLPAFKTVRHWFGRSRILISRFLRGLGGLAPGFGLRRGP